MTLKDYKVVFHVDENLPPFAERNRPQPFHLRAKFEKLLNKLEEEGTIEEHHGPAPWMSNVVLAPKDDGSTRLTEIGNKVNKCPCTKG